MSQICHICGGFADFCCARCEEPVCEECCAVPTYMNQIEETRCTDCEDGIQSARLDTLHREWKEDEEIKATKARKAKARYDKYRLPENVAKRKAAKAERKRLAAIADRERWDKTSKLIGDMFRGMF